MIDIGRAIQHPTQDQDGLKKLGIGALIALVPILNFALNGYAIEHLKNTSDGLDVPLPTWDNLGEKFTNGLKLLVVTLIFALPLFLVSCVATVAGGGLAALAGGEDLGGAAAAGAGVLSLAVACLALIYGLFLGYVTPAIYIQYTKTKEIGACLRIGELLRIARTNTGDYLMIFVALIVSIFVVSLVVVLLNFIPCLGQIVSIVIGFIAAPYIVVLVAHLCGQYVRSNNIIL